AVLRVAREGNGSRRRVSSAPRARVSPGRAHSWHRRDTSRLRSRRWLVSPAAGQPRTCSWTDSCALPRCAFDCIDDVRIGAAAAKIAAHPLTNFIVALNVPFFDAGYSGTNLPRRAVAALKTVMLHERCLNRMQLLAVRQTFDRGDFFAVMNNRETQTGINPPAIH